MPVKVETYDEVDTIKSKAEKLGIPWTDDVGKMEERIEEYYEVLLSRTEDQIFSFIPTDEELNAISLEPISILDDESWVKDFYQKNAKQCGDSLPLSVGPGDPKFLLDNFLMLKRRFVTGLYELDIPNENLENGVEKCQKEANL